MATSPLESLTNIPIAVKQLLGNEIGKVTFVPAPLPHCSGIRQWGNNNGQGSFSRKVYSFPIAYSSAVYMMSANPKGNVGTGATKNAHSANVESLTQFSISVGEHSSMFWFSIGK